VHICYNEVIFLRVVFKEIMWEKNVLPDFLGVALYHSFSRKGINMPSDFNVDNLKQIKELMGDKFDHLVEVYSRTNRKHVENIRAGYASDDVIIILNSAHSMKSSAGNLGLSGLSASTEALEVGAKSVSEGAESLSSYEELIAKIEEQFEAGLIFLNKQQD